MVFCCNNLEKIGNYKKVRRIKYGESMGIYGDNDDTCKSMMKCKQVITQKFNNYELIDPFCLTLRVGFCQL